MTRAPTEPAEHGELVARRTRAGEPTDADGARATPVTSPAKVMRIGSMVKLLLEEVRAAPLDEPSRERLAEIYERSIAELSEALSPDLQRRAEHAGAAVHRRRRPDRGRDPRRQGPARRLAGGPVPRHPGHAVRPAAGRPPAARADAPAPAGGAGAARAAAWSATAAAPDRPPRHLPLARCAPAVMRARSAGWGSA